MFQRINDVNQKTELNNYMLSDVGSSFFGPNILLKGLYTKYVRDFLNKSLLRFGTFIFPFA